MKIKKILVPTDFSECSLRALDQGQALAEHYGAELELLHVLMSHDQDPYSLVYHISDFDEIARRQEEACVEKMGELLGPLDGVAATAHRRRALTVAPAILDFAGERDVDLVVMGGHGRRGLRRFLLGSVAEEVVRLAPCPVLTVRDQNRPLETLSLGHMVVPVDFSESAKRALQMAKELVKAESRIDLVHVVEHPVESRYYDPAHEQARRFEFPEITVRVEEAIGRFVAAAGGLAGDCRIRVLEGAAAARIIEYAEASGAGMIVLATHGLTGLKHFLLGSVTERVVRSAKCPVLTFRAEAG